MKIAISGPMCSGKSTIAKLIKKFNNEYEIYSFGNEIKNIAYELFDMKEKNRSLLINIANKMKDIDKDVWAKHILRKTKNNHNCIIDDLRFQNELELLIKDDWHFIVLNMDINERKQRIKNEYPTNYQDHFNNMNDISETGNLSFPPRKTLHINASQNLNEIYKNIEYFIKKDI
tara:strand:- start:11 stop:532 length:522 start_codon:yes stop_codon:yes gene_type:complete